MKKTYAEKSYEGNCVIRSTYFSKCKVAQKLPGKLGTELPMMDNLKADIPAYAGGKCESLCLSSSSDHLEEMTSHLQCELKVNVGDAGCERLSKERTSKRSQTVNNTKSQGNPRGKMIDLISAGKKKHVPVFSSKLFGPASEPISFASDISHIEQYNSIARKSIERFVSAIASFRCSKSGARASGLRKPTKSNIYSKTNRSFDKTKGSLADLGKFAFTPCRMYVDVRDDGPTRTTAVAASLSASLGD